MTTILSFLAAIAILVFIHEMGHYLAARQCGVQVLRFSVGFGRPLLKWQSPKSGTEWVLAAVPLGGYVRMNDQSFDQQSLGARAWVVFAGPLSNLVFAALAYALLFSIGRDEPAAVLAQPAAPSVAAQAGIQAGDTVVGLGDQEVRSFTELRWRLAQTVVGEGETRFVLKVVPKGAQTAVDVPLAAPAELPSLKAADPARLAQELGLAPLSEAVRVVQVQPGSAAERAGLRAGDRILQVQGQSVDQPEAVISRVQQSNGQPLELVVADESGQERVQVSPTLSPDGKYRMGAVVGAVVTTVHVAQDPFHALIGGVSRTWELSLLTFQALGRMVQGELSWRQISGPVTIADAAGQSAGGGLTSFLGFLALISISIAVLNLLPIPMLDGGHLLYYLWEFVRGSPLPPEVQEAGRRLGLVLIMLLTVVALFNDFSRIAGW